jgi:hypothetical protein
MLSIVDANFRLIAAFAFSGVSLDCFLDTLRDPFDSLIYAYEHLH